MLIASSNLVGRSTVRSAGLAPLRICPHRWWRDERDRLGSFRRTSTPQRPRTACIRRRPGAGAARRGQRPRSGSGRGSDPAARRARPARHHRGVPRFLARPNTGAWPRSPPRSCSTPSPSTPSGRSSSWRSARNRPIRSRSWRKGAGADHGADGARQAEAQGRTRRRGNAPVPGALCQRPPVVPSLTLSAPTAQDWGRVRPSRRASVVRQPPADPTEKKLCRLPSKAWDAAVYDLVE